MHCTGVFHNSSSRLCTAAPSGPLPAHDIDSPLTPLRALRSLPSCAYQTDRVLAFKQHSTR
eukprot:4097108-Pleurochrysis_carterae.AAC.1